MLSANQSHILSSSIFILSVILICILIDLKLDILPIRVVSSAYKIKLNLSLAICKSLMYIINRSGPRIDPWGTPVLIVRMGDYVPPIETNCDLSDK